MRQCKRCELPQPENDFHWRNKAAGARHSRCKACVNELNRRAWHDGDRHGKKARQDAQLDRVKAIVHEAKRVPCMDCGMTYPPYVMDFDHRDPTQKLFTIAQNRAGSITRLLAEIAKCDVVCANCHRVRTHKR